MFRAFENLDEVIKKKNIKVVYHKGYRSWKKRFDICYGKTRSVSRALDEIHGKTSNTDGASKPKS